MKTLICLVLCALVASTYAAPASDLVEIQAQLRSLQDQAEIEGWFSNIVSGAKKGLDIYNKLNGGVELQDDDDDDDIAQMEAFLNNLQEQAEIEKFKFGKAWKKAKKIGSKALKYGKKGYDIYNSVNGGQTAPAEIQDDDDDDIAQLQAFLSNMNEAEQQSWLGTAGKIGLSLLGKK